MVAEREVQAHRFLDQFVGTLQKRIKAESKGLPKMEEDYRALAKTHRSALKKAGLSSVKVQARTVRGKEPQVRRPGPGARPS